MTHSVLVLPNATLTHLFAPLTDGAQNELSVDYGCSQAFGSVWFDEANQHAR
jgi:hypothetical protein